MSRAFDVAVLGASGLVGQHMIEILEEAEESDEMLIRKEHNSDVLEVDEKVEIRNTNTEEKPKQTKKPRKLSKKLIIEDDTTTS